MSTATLARKNVFAASDTEHRYHWTVDTFYRAAKSGVFDNPNEWELINGELWKRQIMNPPHAALLRRVSRLFRQQFEPAYLVMSELPIHLATDGEPIPDACVVIGTEEDYNKRHPEAHEVRLLIEIADSSAERDTNEKMFLYAEAGISEYWVSLINERELVVYRQPTPEGFADVTRLREDSAISPLFAANISIPVRDLLPLS